MSSPTSSLSPYQEELILRARAATAQQQPLHQQQRSVSPVRMQAQTRTPHTPVGTCRHESPLRLSRLHQHPPPPLPPSPPRSQQLLASPRRRPYAGGGGGPVRGREGLPGSFKESRAFSPQTPKHSLRAPVRLAAAAHRNPVADAWRTGKVGACAGGEGLLLLHAAGDRGKRGAIGRIVRGAGLASGEETLEEAQNRADRLQDALDAARAEAVALRRGLLRCERTARPHTVNAEFAEEWRRREGGGGDDSVEPHDDGRANEVLAEEAAAAVAEACGRLRTRMDGALQELVEASAEAHALRQRLKERDETVDVLRARVADLERQVALLSEELAEARQWEPRARDLEAQLAKVTAERDALARELARVQMELDQLRVEFNRLARRKRVVDRDGAAMLPTYRTEEEKAKFKGPPWMPSGGPYKHLLDEEPSNTHKPWLYPTSG